MIIHRLFVVIKRCFFVKGYIMTDLEKARQTIDEADREIAKLFEKRMDAVKVVAEYKGKNGLPIFDEEREKKVISKNVARLENDSIKGYYDTLLRAFMGVSKQYQENLLKGLKIAFCGTEGAFAEIASKRIFPYGRVVAFGDFSGAYNAVLDGNCDCCVLPIENSYAGEVGQVIDLMFEGDLAVNGVYDMQVKQNLIGIKGAAISDVKTVISHPQALSQCNVYIKEHGFFSEQADNTAFAAKKVAQLNEKSVAAIASKETAELYGLEVIDHDINESAVNTTRFAVFSKSISQSAMDNERFILLFTVNDEVGALAKVVNIICAHGFNMRILRSRPVKNIPWQYYFYVEADGDRNSEEGKRMMKELSVCCEKLKIAGHYAASKTI